MHVNRIRKCYFWPAARPEDETQRSEESELQGRDPVQNIDEYLLQFVILENAFLPEYPFDAPQRVLNVQRYDSFYIYLCIYC